ncbi:MAG: bifunctional (p)ppGpp synthetase/guanosine-3',5'-bis(diphosphate) 3'-pyrophosphohydrolase [Firmicutes bacterium]|nr:bifunctional (p)ppGpp synthetase/guanosine-3',5'-bis(diphosphate) 3'-pyrophosphohydrolase [Bacillota bacterium]MDD4337585.1 bifunctional (p)ppGpp synthetase/guanosine-3',5'-bis(diphosphate) 3'-pyrophosphohydrolase [Bacillota bacterium]MDD4792736.1 bifunctional (p)ppGpp synthetase/guanosine-3',5'-bis(diphosphate) 3'-pyrophosphohydrolase [Bacillota bacterium]
MEHQKEEHTLDGLLEKARANRPDVDLSLIQNAWSYAQEAHDGQVRESGEPYFDHPVSVAFILADMNLDANTMAAGLLHDVIEDTGKSYEEISEAFGSEIATLVDGVTKLSRMDFKSREEQQAESLRKMFVAMAKDIRVILIKLADRLHNMRTLDYSPPEKQKRVAGETLEIYAPLAHRLGMWRMKWELEDLSLRYLDSMAYYELVEKVATKRQEREGYIEEARRTLEAALGEIGISAEIQGRPKHFYSIYRKMEKQGKDFGEIWDLMGLRVIVGTLRECYAVLGAVHSIWKPIPGRFKDYVAMPKSNMYQSLHTTVIGPRGEPLEIQIRTWEMHRTAEYGIAAHWRYKEGGGGGGDFEEKITWLRQILEWQKETRNGTEFVETLKVDLFSDEVYVFTPRGDVKTLPAGSTPVDFAYSIHTDVGHSCSGARVNGRMVPLSKKLSTGDIVEIITSKSQAGPSRDWLAIAKTSKAKGKIRQWLKEQRREASVEQGKELIEKELRRLGLEVRANMKDERLLEVAQKFSYQSANDLLGSVGYGKVSAAQVVTRLVPDRVLDEVPKPFPTRSKSRSSHGVSVPGVDNVLVRFARCCNPVPGDEIIGYVTRGRGVSVHRLDCRNASIILDNDEERAVEVCWDTKAGESYPVDIEMEAYDAPGLLTLVINTTVEMKAHVSAVTARTVSNRLAVINMTMEINDVKHMNSVIERLKRISGVQSVRRAVLS